MQYLSFILMTLIIILSAITWFEIISILKENNYKVTNIALGQVKILMNFFLLILKERNFKLKMKYSIIFILIILFVILFFYLAIISFSYN